MKQKVFNRLMTPLFVASIAGSLLFSVFLTLRGVPVQAAPPVSILVSPSLQSNPAAECTFVLTSDTGYSTSNAAGEILGTRTGGTPVQSYLDAINASPSLKSDYDAIMASADPDLGADIKPVVYMYLNQLNGSEGGDNDTTCNDGGIFFSRPGNPTQFFGFINSSGLVYPTYVPPTAGATMGKFVFGGQGGSTQYDVKADPDSPDILTNPAFSSAADGTGTTGEGGAVGFCAQYDISGLEGLRSECMKAKVIDFNTIQYRGETYTLRGWTRDMYYDLSVAGTDSRKSLEDKPVGERPYFALNTETYDLNVDGDVRSSDKADVFRALAALPESGTMEFNDTDFFTGADIDPVDVTVFNFQNLRLMFEYSATSNAVGMKVNSPDSSERRLVGDGIYTQRPAETNTFEGKQVSSDCTQGNGLPRLVFSTDPSTITTTNAVEATWYYPTNTENCDLSQAPVLVRMGSTLAIGDIVAGTVAPAGDGGNAENEAPAKTCASEGGALGWILCPVLTLLDEGTQAMESQIQSFLFVDTNRFTTESGAYQAWSTFRGLATVIIVIVALIMIFSQAMGDGIFDNYSVKKLLPRLLIAGIGIQLSWFLITQLVNVFNILGNGIGGLLLSSFDLNNGSNLRDQIGDITRQASVGDAAAGVGFVGLVILGPALMGGILAVAIGAAAAIFVGLITLIVRDMIILLGVVLAPVAIAMSVLPGTQKTSKWWWESLEKALAMYPIVMALLASGKVVATLLFDSATPEGDGGIKVVYLIAGIVAWYAPFFFLPKALQAGGSALGKISGFAGDKSKGMFDKARQATDSRKKFRQGLKQEARVRSASGQGYWQGKGGKFGSGMNALMQGQSKTRIRTQSGLPIIPIKQRVKDRVGAAESSAASKVEKAAMEEFQTRWGREVKNGRVVGGNDEELIKIALTTSNGTERQAALDQLGKLGSKQLLHVENALNGATAATKARGLAELSTVTRMAPQEVSRGLSNIGEEGFARTKQDNYGNIKDKLPVLAGKDYHKLGSGALAEISADSISDMAQKYSTYTPAEQQTLKANITEYISNTNLHGKIDAAGMEVLDRIRNSIP